jgi:hypothetical protein
MRPLALLLVLASAVWIAWACATPADLTPKTGVNTEYPCGVHGVVCPGKQCCSEEETCGGAFPSIGCPAGQCCYIGPDSARRGDAGDAAKAHHPQTPAAP